jgi:hypothetical protein
VVDAEKEPSCWIVSRPRRRHGSLSGDGVVEKLKQHVDNPGQTAMKDD